MDKFVIKRKRSSDTIGELFILFSMQNLGLKTKSLCFSNLYRHAYALKFKTLILQAVPPKPPLRGKSGKSGDMIFRPFGGQTHMLYLIVISLDSFPHDDPIYSQRFCVIRFRIV